jgi:hypothetical protein
MKVEATEARLSATLGLSRLGRRCVCQAKDGRTRASPHRDPLADGRGIERMQRRRLRLVDAIASLVTQQAPAHEQAQGPPPNETEEFLDLFIRGCLRSHEPEQAIRLSNENPVDSKCMKVHVQVERAAKALDDGNRPSAAILCGRCLGSLPVEAEQGTRVDREHRAAERVIPRKPIAKLEGKATGPIVEPACGGARGR